MPRFPDPDIDPALNAEAQAVVNEAASSMKTWLNQQFDSIESNVRQEVDKAVAELDGLIEQLRRDDAERTATLEQSLATLGEAAKQLTELDEDQRQVLEQLAQTTEAVKQELAARTERWQGLGKKTVDITKLALRRALGGIV